MGPAWMKSNGFLARLRREQRGNTLAIVAMSLFPLAGMIGGGLDLSRAYLVKTRLNQACDAGVLAGRKAMGSGGSITTAVTTEVQKYVNFNFPSGYVGTPTAPAMAVTPTLGTNDQIQLALTTTVPTAVMRLFGKETIPVNVSCSARNDYANVDIVLVLDTTGSMACAPERTDCSSWINNNNRGGRTMTVDGRTVTYVLEETSSGANISRMKGLRDALSALRTQMGTIETQFNTAPVATRKRVRFAIVPFSQMVNAGRSTDTSATTLFSRQNGWFNTTGDYRDGSTTCGRSSCNYVTDTVTHNNTWLTNTWDGCVEERATSNTVTASAGYSIPNNTPSNAFDLQLDLTPTQATHRWTVADPSQTGSAQYACPKAMRELAPMTTGDFNAYFTLANGFSANGGTYLDLGMLWAARLFSRTGLWAGNNPTLFNTFPVSRYVIFMTDGEMDTGNSGYGAYAQERYWQRIAADGTVSTSNSNHSQRLAMICTAIKNMDAKIFAISFGAGSTLGANMTGCSSGDGYAFKADSSAGLAQVFRDIGENIGSLRLSQ